MTKKTVAILMTLSLVFAGIPAMAGTAYAGTTTPDVQVRGESTAILSDNHEGGYIETEMDRDVPKAKNEESEADSFNKGGYPAAYPSGGIDDIRSMFPPTRKQSPYGTCWAHGVAACADFDMVKNHGQTAYTFNVSELQLAYYTYNPGMDRLGYLNGDSNSLASTAKDHFLNIGGNANRAMRTLSQWKGFTYESTIPYSSAENVLAYGLTSSYAYRNDATKLEKAYIVDSKENRNAIKQAVMQYGAVAVSYQYDTAYYNKNTNAYRNPYDLATDHASAIVGWNDNFPASSFGYPASRNGAWLIRNSGTTDNVASNAGYFWMSYEDASLAEAAYVMDFMPSESYDHNYQHDGTIATGSIGVETAANVFTARNMNGAASETLDAVMLSFDGEAGVRYQIDIYSSLTDRSNPESGYHHSAATTTGTLTYAGVYTIPLREKVYLAPGETFSVVVKSLDGKRYFDSELSVTYKYDDGTARYNIVSHIDPQESFYKGSISDKTWADCATDGLTDYGNLCIKAFTNDSSVKKYTISYHLNGGVNNASNPVSYLSSWGGSVTLKNPTRNGYHFLGWYSDAAYTKKVTTISYYAQSNQMLYAKWCADNSAARTSVVSPATSKADGSYRVTCGGCGLLKGTYPLYSVDSIKLNTTKPTYTGENVNPYPVIKDSNGNQLVEGTDYTYQYSKSARKKTGRYYITVTFNQDKYKMDSKKLYFTIVPKAPSSASAKLYSYNDVKVSWSKCTGASGYYVYYKTSKATKYSKYKRTTKTSFKFNDLSGNVKYNFKIVPYYKKGDTYYKASKYKTVSATTLKKLSQPSIKRVSGGKVSLQWKSISGASGYQVFWSRTKSGKYNKLCDYSSKYTGVTFTVGKGEPYWYKTRAYQYVGSKKIYGPWSTPKKFIR